MKLIKKKKLTEFLFKLFFMSLIQKECLIMDGMNNLKEQSWRLSSYDTKSQLNVTKWQKTLTELRGQVLIWRNSFQCFCRYSISLGTSSLRNMSQTAPPQSTSELQLWSKLLITSVSFGTDAAVTCSARRFSS